MCFFCLFFFVIYKLYSRVTDDLEAAAKMCLYSQSPLSNCGANFLWLLCSNNLAPCIHCTNIQNSLLYNNIHNVAHIYNSSNYTLCNAKCICQVCAKH